MPVVDELQTWTAGAPQYDDLTFVLMKIFRERVEQPVRSALLKSFTRLDPVTAPKCNPCDLACSFEL